LRPNKLCKFGLTAAELCAKGKDHTEIEQPGEILSKATLQRIDLAGSLIGKVLRWQLTSKTPFCSGAFLSLDVKPKSSFYSKEFQQNF
jgi:hypothetical protein